MGLVRSSNDHRFFQAGSRAAHYLEASRNTFIKTFVLATIAGTILFYAVPAIAVLLSGVLDSVYFQGEGLWGNMSLFIFTLVMALAISPFAFPLVTFAAFAAFLLVPPIHWCVKHVLTFLARMTGKHEGYSGGETGRVIQFRR